MIPVKKQFLTSVASKDQLSVKVFIRSQMKFPFRTTFLAFVKEANSKYRIMKMLQESLIHKLKTYRIPLINVSQMNMKMQRVDTQEEIQT